MDSKEIKEKVKEGWIKAHILFEVIGKPAEHIIEALNKLVEVLKQEKKIIIISSKVNEAIETENNFFSSFAELEILLKDSKSAIEFVFDYMPASIEISEPSNFSLRTIELNNILNDLATKLHRYDGALKQLNLEKQILLGHIQEIKKVLEEKGIKLVVDRKEKKDKEDKKEKTK